MGKSTSTGCNYTIYGCTDSNASNNPNANANDGSCSSTTNSMSLSPSVIVEGQSATLTWVLVIQLVEVCQVLVVFLQTVVSVTPLVRPLTLSMQVTTHIIVYKSKTLTVVKPEILYLSPTTINSGQSGH